MSDIFTKKDWIYRYTQSFPLSLCSQNLRRKEKWCQVARKSLPHEKNKLKWHFPPGVLKSLMKTAWGKSSARPVPFPSQCGMGEGVELAPLCRKFRREPSRWQFLSSAWGWQQLLRGSPLPDSAHWQQWSDHPFWDARLPRLLPAIIK